MPYEFTIFSIYRPESKTKFLRHTNIFNKGEGCLYILSCSSFVLISEGFKGSQKVTFCLLYRRSLSEESKGELLIAIHAVPSSSVALYMCFVFFHIVKIAAKVLLFFELCNSLCGFMKIYSLHYRRG